jgi:DNA-binding beta-propeller fold protein YncE
MKRMPVLILVLLLPVLAAVPAAPAPNLQLRWLLPENTGQFVYAFMYRPKGVAVDNQGNVYVLDTYDRVQKFDSGGRYLTQWGSHGSGNGELYWPEGLAADKQGNFYVADTWNNRIQMFDAAGNYLRQWGTQGSGNGQLAHPEGVAVDAQGNIYVADTLNHRIQNRLLRLSHPMGQ